MRIGKWNIGPGFFLLLALLVAFDTDGLAPYIAAAVLLHELAHYGVLRFYDGEVKEVAFRLTGIEMQTANTRLIGYLGEILICLSGPVVNLLVALVCSLLGRRTGGGALYLFAGINLTLGLFNLLPIWGLDGGRALSFLLEWLFGSGNRAEQIISLFFSLLIAALGVWLFLATKFNFTMLAISAWALMKPVRGLEKRRETG